MAVLVRLKQSFYQTISGHPANQVLQDLRDGMFRLLRAFGSACCFSITPGERRNFWRNFATLAPPTHTCGKISNGFRAKYSLMVKRSASNHCVAGTTSVTTGILVEARFRHSRNHFLRATLLPRGVIENCGAVLTRYRSPSIHLRRRIMNDNKYVEQIAIAHHRRIDR